MKKYKKSYCGWCRLELKADETVLCDLCRDMQFEVLYDRVLQEAIAVAFCSHEYVDIRLNILKGLRDVLCELRCKGSSKHEYMQKRVMNSIYRRIKL